VLQENEALRTKVCSRCGVEKTVAEYHKSRRNSLGVNHRCKICMIDYKREWEASHPDPAVRKAHKSALQRARVARLPDISVGIPLDTPRMCTACGQTKTVNDFQKDKKGTLGRGSKCKACQSAYQKSWREQKAYSQLREGARRAKYGMASGDFDKLLAGQNSACAICRIDLDPLSKKTCIDHCHATGAVRGVLCKKCNTTLGWARDDVKWLGDAIAYLNRNGGGYGKPG
jgi:hypothetical protein